MLEYHMPRMTKPEISMPKNLLAVVKKGTVRGSVPSKLRLFQSNAGQGLKPKPLLKPVRTASVMLVGSIQVIQLK